MMLSNLKVNMNIFIKGGTGMKDQGKTSKLT